MTRTEADGQTWFGHPRGLTILFLSAASILFFRGVSDIFPFIYASRPPLP